MKRLQAFKFELKLSLRQQRQLAGFAGACRFVYNKSLALQKARYEEGEKKLTYAGLCKQLTGWRNDATIRWLAQAPSQALQQSLNDLERAYKNFFLQRAGFPKFKKRGNRDSFRFPQGVKVDQKNNRLCLPKLGWVRYRNSRDILGAKKKFSKNWKKVNYKVGRLHRKIARIRHNYLHQLTHTISKNHAMVCVEDLQIKNMSKSASGTIARPGKQVKAKSGLNKGILDQGWYEFRRQLEYKQSWRGGIVIAVAPHYTSQACPECMHVAAMNRQTQSAFECVKCGYENNADIVGAINILRAGHARLACGEKVQLGRSMNQEPTDVAKALVAA